MSQALHACAVQALQAWRSLGWREWLGYTVLGLISSLIELSNSVYLSDADPWLLAQYLGRYLLEPQLVIACMLLVWLPVARSDIAHPRRLWRLTVATLLSALLGALLIQAAERWLAWPSYNQLLGLPKGKADASSSHWTALLGLGLTALIPCALLAALDEMRQRQVLARRQLQQVLQQQSSMARQILANRLAALQAQVEPELLFDTLVHIEQAYERAEPRAAVQMERLIRHLRVALPRLRDSGTRLGSEAELLDSYLAVMAGLRGCALHFSSDWPAALNDRALPPMLLLPLLQRALRLAWQEQQRLPSHCQLKASVLGPGEQGLRLELRLSLPGLCGDDESLREVAARLRASSAGPAELRCHSEAEHTVFTLELEP